jgi:hypothetical protein
VRAHLEREMRQRRTVIALVASASFINAAV